MPYSQPSEKQERYQINLANGMNRRQAALKAGYSETRANVMPYDKRVNKLPKEILLKAMKAVGLKERYLATKMLEGLESHKTIYATHEGKITDTMLVPDNENRSRTLRTVLEVREDLKQNTQNTVNLGLIGLSASESAETWDSASAPQINNSSQPAPNDAI